MDSNTVDRKRRKRIGGLRNASDVTKYIGNCIKRVEWGGEGGDPNINYKLVMMSSILLKSIEVSELEARITNLEKTNGNRR